MISAMIFALLIVLLVAAGIAGTFAELFDDRPCSAPRSHFEDPRFLPPAHGGRPR